MADELRIFTGSANEMPVAEYLGNVLEDLEMLLAQLVAGRRVGQLRADLTDSINAVRRTQKAVEQLTQ